MKLYLAAPYTGNEEAHTQMAEQWGRKLQQAGHIVVIPHASHYIDRNWKRYAGYDAGYEYWIQHGLTLLSACEAMVLEGNWKKSKGCRREHRYAQKHGIQVYFGIESVPPEENNDN